MRFDNLNDFPEWDDERFKDKYDEGDEWKNASKNERAKALYNQWLLVFNMVQGLMEILVPNEETPGDYLDHLKSQVIGDAALVPVKIRGAEAGDMYVLRMENASIIRTAANAVYIAMSGFRMMNVAEDKHLDAMRKEINLFRDLFKEWVNGFEKDEFEDEWGLFT